MTLSLLIWHMPTIFISFFFFGHLAQSLCPLHAPYEHYAPYCLQVRTRLHQVGLEGLAHSRHLLGNYSQHLVVTPKHRWL